MVNFKNEDSRNQAIKEMMAYIRKNTMPSKCIDTYEKLLGEISDKNVVDTAVKNMLHFIEHFSIVCDEVDNMNNTAFIANVLTVPFVKPFCYFRESRKLANQYLMLSDMLKSRYHKNVYKDVKDVIISNKCILGPIYHKLLYSIYVKDGIELVEQFGKINGLSDKEVREKLESARQVVLLYNYMPAVVKALIQTKRRSLGLDRNSKRFK